MAPVSHNPSAPKCMKIGPITRNGYLNFLRDFRKSNFGLSAVEMVGKGAEKWRSMSEKDKEKYIKLAQSAPKIQRRSRTRSSRIRDGRKPSDRMRGGRIRLLGRRKKMRSHN